MRTLRWNCRKAAARPAAEWLRKYKTHVLGGKRPNPMRIRETGGVAENSPCAYWLPTYAGVKTAAGGEII